MNTEEIRSALGWCTLINYGILLFWFGMLVLQRDWVYRFHGRWFPLPRETFDAIHYGLMGIFKLGVFLFNLVPYIALRIIA